MPNLFLTPVGTSSLTNFVYAPHGREFAGFFKERIEGREIEGVEDVSKSETLKERIVAHIRQNYHLELAKPPRERKLVLSAEMTSLEMLKQSKICVGDRDAVALFYSDTRDGLLAARINREILSDTTGISQIEMYRLAGVSARDVDSFSAAVNGQSIRAVLDRARADFSSFTPVIVFTGGFKGLIPLLTLYAWESRTLKMDMYYLYERSNRMVCYRFKGQGEPGAGVEVSPLDVF